MKTCFLCILAAVVVCATPVINRVTEPSNSHQATAAAKQSSGKQSPHEFFALRLGMSEEAVRSRLRKIAKQQKEEREEEEGGEQEVWILKRDAKFNYLLVKFNKEHRLNWMTVVAHPKLVRYADLAGLELATKATDGINYSYKWKVETSKQQPGYLIIARGSSDEFLTSYSVYPTR
jgi:cell division protein FtsL